jgi:hypothetical protein
MPAEPSVSVCIRAYNRPDELRAAIASALAQTYDDLEVVVSDDSGRWRHVAEGFGDPRVRYHPNPAPSGPAGNLSRAASLARGRFIAILNDDDRWLPGFLEATVGVLERDPDVGVAFTDDYFEIGGRRARRALPFTPGRHDNFLPELLAHSMPASASVVRRSAWDDGERRVPVSSEVVGDALVWLRTASAGWPFHYIDEPLGISGLSASQVTWSEAGLPSRMIATHEAFRFDDPACEALRRARVAEFLLSRAHRHLASGRLRDAWQDVGRAHSTSPRTLGIRALLALTGARARAVRWAIDCPHALVPMLGLWRRLRPAVLR